MTKSLFFSPLRSSRGVHLAAGDEVREQGGAGLLLEDGDLGLKKLDEVVGKDGGGEADGDTVDAEHEAEGDFGGEQDGLFVAAVVAGDVFGDFRGEELLAGELGEAALNVTACGGLVAGKDVAEVALALDEVTFIGKGDDGVFDGGVAMRVVVHGVADDAGDLGEAAVVLFPHGVEDTALDGLEAVLDGGEGAVAD